MARRASAASRKRTPAKSKLKAASGKEVTSPSRSNARQANKKFDDENSTDVPPSPSVKLEESTSPYKANMGAKRAGSSQTSTLAKRAKIEAPEDTKQVTGPASHQETASEDGGFDESDYDVSEESQPNSGKRKRTARAAKSKRKSAVPLSAPNSKCAPPSQIPSTEKERLLQVKKLKSYAQFSSSSPFPEFGHPTADEARLAHRILAKLHGERVRPERVVARSDRAGCGDSPSVLDALVRTILSQNTSDKNSTRAKLSMDKVYGGHDRWEDIVQGGQAKLQKAIECGGLSVVKSKVIISILEQTKEKYGEYSLDHLFQKDDEEAMTELISMKGVGPKTASCVLLFCLQRESFAVDTHVYRIAGLLGWRPASATRDETHAHLEVRIPDEEKYGLHILMVTHGKKCEECKAGGRSVGQCELRRAFRKGKLDGLVGSEMKEKEEELVEKAGEDVDKVKEEDVKGLQLKTDEGQEEYLHGMEGKTGGKHTSTKRPLKGRK